MSKNGFIIKLLYLIVLAMIFSGCSLNYTIKDPVLSNINYANNGMEPVTLNIVDQRKGSDAVFLVGKLGAGASMSDISNILKFNNIENPMSYFAQHLEKELVRRGIPVKCVADNSARKGLVLRVNKYQIVNYRATGFSPWEACHIFAGTIIMNEKEKSIKAYFYNGKTPVWSMDEILEPCFNIPSSILIKEIASKINSAVFNFQVPNAKIEELEAEIDSQLQKAETDGPFWKVLELGYTNNPDAMAPLKRYAVKGDEFFKSCALSAIGVLGPEGQLEFLKMQYASGGFNDKYMAAKAIGDIDSPEALQAIQDIKKEKDYQSHGGLRSCVDLYTP